MNTLNFRGKTFDATGYFLEARLIGSTSFCVVKGSKAKIDTNKSFETTPYKKIRDNLIERGILKKIGNYHFEFTEDYVFDSGGAAASVVSGASKSPAMWK